MRILATFLLFLSMSFGFEMPQVRGVLSDVKDGGARIENSDKIVLGSSGVVIRNFKNGESSIIARAVVTQKGGAYANVRFEVFENLAQDALPIPGVMPKNGDTIILNYLYSRAVIVAPNESVYKQVSEHFKNITFISPDVAAAYLADIHSPSPNRTDFRNICYQNAAGLIFIAFDGEGVFADCGSFKTLHSFKSGKVSGYMRPFYSNVRKISEHFWDINDGQIGNYEKYYRKLIKQNEGE